MNTEISNLDDILDVRDIIERVEELEAAALIQSLEELEVEERKVLEALLGELKGNGGDEQWRGDWYPLLLIRDRHFQDYAEQLADDIGAINSDATWPNNCIDWERAAKELQYDYSAVDFDGVTYWYR